MASRPCLVEFFGLPGAGKTTLAREVVNGLRESGERCICSWDVIGCDEEPFIYRQLKRARAVCCAICLCPAISWRAARFVFRTKQSSLLDGIKVAWNLLVVIGFMAVGIWQKRTIIVLDQGIFQALWSVCFKALSPMAFNDAICFISRIDTSRMAFVYVVAAAEVIRSRLRMRRTTARIQHGCRFNHENLWHKATELTEKLAEHMHNLHCSGKIAIMMEVENSGILDGKKALSVSRALIAEKSPF